MFNSINSTLPAITTHRTMKQHADNHIIHICAAIYERCIGNDIKVTLASYP